jgi:hypothetical protein
MNRAGGTDLVGSEVLPSYLKDRGAAIIGNSLLMFIRLPDLMCCHDRPQGPSFIACSFHYDYNMSNQDNASRKETLRENNEARATETEIAAEQVAMLLLECYEHGSRKVKPQSPTAADELRP